METIEGIILWIKSNPILSMVVAYIIGGSTVWPILKKIAASTPTQMDDMLVSAVETAFEARRGEIEKASASEIEKRLSDKVVIEIVKLRKARWAEMKKAKQ